jgi:hypothetical protein
MRATGHIRRIQGKPGHDVWSVVHTVEWRSVPPNRPLSTWAVPVGGRHAAERDQAANSRRFLPPAGAACRAIQAEQSLPTAHLQQADGQPFELANIAQSVESRHDRCRRFAKTGAALQEQHFPGFRGSPLGFAFPKNGLASTISVSRNRQEIMKLPMQESRSAARRLQRCGVRIKTNRGTVIQHLKRGDVPLPKRWPAPLREPVIHGRW